MPPDGAALQQLLGGGGGRPRFGTQAFTMPSSLPPPLGGWNTRDAFATMEPGDAIILDNWFPDFAGVVVRPGATPWLNLDTGEPVPTLAVWRAEGAPGGADGHLIAASNGNLYDASGGGTDALAAPPPLATGFTSDWWQTVLFNKRLFLVNGVDPPQVYDGTTVAAAGFAAATGQPALDPSILAGVQAIHNRLFFWAPRQTGFWYGVLFGITGDLHWFPFDMVVPDGGGLIAVEVLSYDGGTGIESYTVFVLDTGTLLTYRGSDPSNPDNWSLVGLYTVAPPMGLRGAERYGGDIYLATTADAVKLSTLIAALKQGEMPPRSKISGAARAAAALSHHLPGWQAIYWPFGRRLIYNIPLPDGNFEQFVYNPPLNAWARWRGWPASCWCVWGDRLMFGAPRGQVCRADSATSDWVLRIQPPWNTTPWNTRPWLIGGEKPITATAQQAWQMFNSPLIKRVAAVRPIVESRGPIDYDFRLGFDYRDPEVFVPVGQAGRLASPWDVSAWDVSPWSGEASVEASWQIAGGEGNAISFAIAVSGRAALSWVRTDFRIEPGSAL